jgi:hypothetical protein
MKHWHHHQCRSSGKRGFAVPAALLFTVTITLLAAIFAQMANNNLVTAKQSEATADTLDVAEGAAHDTLRQIILSPHLWRQKVALSTLPNGYTMYDPASFGASNGIPTCSGISCERNLYPTGGGLIKNLGPIGGDGDSVDAAYNVMEQLDPANPPTADITLNTASGWVQVERLDESAPGTSTIGADLSNNPQAGASANVVRFRLTGTAIRSVKGRTGQATVVLILEVPNA